MVLAIVMKFRGNGTPEREWGGEGEDVAICQLVHLQEGYTDSFSFMC